MARVSSKPKASQTKTQKKEVTVSSPKRKRVEAEKNSLVRSKTGSAFARCEECKKDVPVMLVDMHDCSQESKIKMKMESMVVERVVEEKTQTEKKKAGKTSSKARKTSKTSSPKAKKAAKAKDPNMPKRPQTAFFVFMEEFRKTYKEEFPENKSAPLVGKAGGEKWNALSDEEKKVYLDKAAVLKEQYLKAMEKYNLANENAEEQDEEAEKAESDVVDAEKEDSNEADAENEEEADEVEKDESDDLEKKLAAELEDEE